MKAFYLLLVAALYLNCICFSVAQQNVTRAIPLSMMRSTGMLDAMSSGHAFTEKLFEDLERNRPRSGTIRPNIAMAAMLDHAGCQPYDQVVPLANESPDVIMYPSCVLAKQCGGCCGHPALMCKASTVEPKLVQVAKYIYDGTSMFPEEKIDYVTVEQHMACECMCKVQESDCNANLHEFDRNECQCKCRNRDQSGSCPGNKMWDTNTCACRCSAVVNCGTGYTYDLNTCTCEEVTERGGDVPSANNNPQLSPSAPSEPEQEICPHIKCPRRYIKAMRPGGRCGCIYDRSRNRG